MGLFLVSALSLASSDPTSAIPDGPIEIPGSGIGQSYSYYHDEQDQDMYAAAAPAAQPINAPEGTPSAPETGLDVQNQPPPAMLAKPSLLRGK